MSTPSTLYLRQRRNNHIAGYMSTTPQSNGYRCHGYGMVSLVIFNISQTMIAIQESIYDVQCDQEDFRQYFHTYSNALKTMALSCDRNTHRGK